MKTMHNNPADQSYALWRQALSGDTEGTYWAIEQMELTGMPILTADLLARLCVRTGRFAQAKILWQNILQADPNYSPAIQALKKMNTRWLVFATVKKFSKYFMWGLLSLLSCFGIGMLFFGSGHDSYPLIGAGIVLLALAVYMIGFFVWAILAVSAECSVSWQQQTVAPQQKSFQEEYTDKRR